MIFQNFLLNKFCFKAISGWIFLNTTDFLFFYIFYVYTVNMQREFRNLTTAEHAQAVVLLHKEGWRLALSLNK